MSRERPGLLQGDIVELDGSLHVIMSRSCDLPRDYPQRAIVAPLAADPSSDVTDGLDVRRVRVPSHPGKHADLTCAAVVDKAELPQQATERGCPEAEDARRFREDAGRFLAMSSLPAAVSKIVDPMWKHMKKKRHDEGYADMLNAIVDVRVRFRPDAVPGDEETNRSMTIIFVVRDSYEDLLPEEPQQLPHDLGAARDRWLESSALPERAVVLDGYCQLLASRCKVQDPVEEVDAEVVTETTFALSDYFATDALRIETLSP